MAQQMVAFRLDGLADLDCCQRAEAVARGEQGVLAAQADLRAGQLQVQFDPARWDRQQFVQNLAQNGFRVLAEVPPAGQGCC